MRRVCVGCFQSKLFATCQLSALHILCLETDAIPMFHAIGGPWLVAFGLLRGYSWKGEIWD